MRLLIAATTAAVAALCLTGSGPLGVWASAHWPFESERDRRQRVAIELRCGNVDGQVAPACERDLADRFAAGETDPESIVRLHCTHFQNVWDRDQAPELPPLCSQQDANEIAG